MLTRSIRLIILLSSAALSGTNRNQNETMKYTIVQIRDFYNQNHFAGVRVIPIAMNEIERNQYGCTHYAEITASQIKNLYRRLSNGPRGLNFTSFDQFTGKPDKAEIYFDLEA